MIQCQKENRGVVAGMGRGKVFRDEKKKRTGERGLKNGMPYMKIGGWHRGYMEREVLKCAT